MTPPRAAASAPMKFATSSSSMSINMSSFGLCTAVVTSKFAGRDTSSFSTAITSSSSSSSSSGVTSIQVLENDVLQAKALVKNLKTSYQLRLQEIKGTLEKASLGGLQTLQLMLKDYLRSVDKAVDTLKTCMSHTYTLGQAVQPEEDAQCVFPDKIWQVFLQRPSFKFNQEQDPTEEEVKQDDNEEIPVVWLKEDKPEQAEQPEQHIENLPVHVVQTNHLPVAACTVDTNTQALGAMRVMTKLFIDLIKKAYTEFLASEWRHHVDFVSVGCLFVTYVCLLVMLFKVQQAQRSISQLVLQHISTQDAQDFTNFLETAQISFISKIRSM
jgi:hypothetical protein